MFVSKKKWNQLALDMFKLQETVFAMELALSYHKRLHDADNKEKAKQRHPSSPKKTTTKKVDKNGK